MPLLPKKEVERALLQKGFRPEQGDHNFFRLYVDGKRASIQTKTSHGKKKYRELGPELVSRMSKQLKLTSKQFKNLVECPLTYEDYVALLIEQGIKVK